MIFICKECKKEFYEKPARFKVGRGKFCSLTCRKNNKRRHFNKIEEINKLYGNGYNLRQIADLFDCSPSSIKNIMVENNLERRDMHDRPYLSGVEHPGWKGGHKTGAHVYKMLKSPAAKYGYEYEHRMIVEAKVGRKLRTDEHVHHINFDPTDNRPENLMLMTAKEHLKFHGKLRRKPL